MKKTIEDIKIGLALAKLAKEKKFDAIVKGSITEYLNTKIDNLLKGAAGQAVQNMNIMLGIDETTGLS